MGRDIARDRNYSEEVAFAIDQEVRRITDECYDKATRLLMKTGINLTGPNPPGAETLQMN